MGERSDHDAFGRFEAIAREVDRLRTFETVLPDGLLRLRESVDALSRSSIALPRLRLDQAVGPADRLVGALRRWGPGLDPGGRSVAMAEVMMAVVDLESTLDLLPMMVHRAEREAAGPVRSSEHGLASFYRLANDYDRDARRHSGTMIGLYVVALAALVVAVGAAIWAAGGGLAGRAPTWNEFVARGQVVIVTLIAAAASIWQADRHRRIGAEQLRLARQLRTFPTFINEMSSDILQDLMRGALTPRFFPRALDDDDVLREPLWPNPDQLRSVLLIDPESEEVSPDGDADDGKRKSSSDTQASP
jgi:hypothetical protein